MIPILVIRISRPAVSISLAFPNGGLHQRSLAWAYLYADITDWYREEVQLDENGKPSATLFQGEWKPLTTHSETFRTRG